MKILLTRLSSMGDLIHTLPAIDDLSRFCPEIELHWMCETGFTDIAQLHPFVKKAIPMNWRKWRKHIGSTTTWQQLQQLRQTLRQEKYDFVLDSQSLLKSAIFSKLADAPIYGLDWNSAREPLASLAYQKTFTVPKGKNAIWRNRQLFAQIFQYEPAEQTHFGAVIPSEVRVKALPTAYHIALHATSRDSKLWPENDWYTLLNQLFEQDGLPVLLPWGNEQERQRAERIAKHVPSARICPPVSLLQAAYILNHAKIIIGVDTGLLHLANALDKPIVGIYTDSDPNKTGVQPSNWAINLGNVGIIPSINEVFQAALHIQNNDKTNI